MLLLGHNFYLEKIPGPTHKMVGALFKEGVDIFLNKVYYQLGRSYVSLKYRHVHMSYVSLGYRHVHIHKFDNFFL